MESHSAGVYPLMKLNCWASVGSEGGQGFALTPSFLSFKKPSAGSLFLSLFPSFHSFIVAVLFLFCPHSLLPSRGLSHRCAPLRSSFVHLSYIPSALELPVEASPSDPLILCTSFFQRERYRKCLRSVLFLPMPKFDIHVDIDPQITRKGMLAD